MAVPTWTQVAEAASKMGAKFPELVAAQFALESNWGRAVSGKNNYFGIKGKGTQVKTTEFYNGKEVVVYDEFKDFTSLDECVKWLVDKWYLDYKDYTGINSADTREAAARMLVEQNYATDPLYAEKLIDIMSKNSAPRTVEKMQRPINLRDAAKYYSNQPHQNLAWDELQITLTKEVLEKFASRYRTPVASFKPGKPKFPLDVAYFYQRDSRTGHGERSCQSSAIAMVIEYFDPSLIRDDDDYLRIVLKHGDTVSQTAQAKALGELGVKAQFKMNGNESSLLKLLDLGIPVPIGILHKGPISNPSGGGHWVTLIGYDEKYFNVHDPFGCLDLINGGYPEAGPSDGKNALYTRKNLMKRWLIANPNDGWYWEFARK